MTGHQPCPTCQSQPRERAATCARCVRRETWYLDGLCAPCGSACCLGDRQAGP